MDSVRAVADVILFFKNAWVIVLALALAEAFKQFVNDKAQGQSTPLVHWDRLPALASFLFLIVPFFHGMTRYLFTTYSDVLKMPEPYSLFLLIDGAAFMLEAAIFFVMSRALFPDRWREFYRAVLALLYVDSLWAFTTAIHGTPIVAWSILNLVFGGLVAALLWFFRAGTRPILAPILGAGLMIVRTVIDYISVWSFYFPKVQP